LVSLPMLSPIMWRKEHLWNFSVLQSVYLSNHIIKTASTHEQKI
jgi:hypothetical protein